MEFPVGEFTLVARLAFKEDGGGIGFGFQMAIQAVVCDVELATDEPLAVGWCPFEGLFPGFEPVEFCRLVRPVLEVIFVGRFVE